MFTQKKLTWILVLLTVVPRLMVLGETFTKHTGPNSPRRVYDAYMPHMVYDGYVTLADSMIHRRTYSIDGVHPATTRAPLLPLLLIPGVALNVPAKWTVFLQIVLTVAAVLNIRLAAEAFGASRIAAFCAAAFVSLDPWFITALRYASTTMVALLLITLILRLLAARRSGWLGVCCGLLALCHPSCMFALPGALAADGFRRGWSGLLRRSIVPILAYVLILSPWIIRNYAVTRRFIPGVDGFGYQYLLGSSAMKFGVPLPKSIEPLLPKGHEQVLFATLDKEANQKLDEIAKREMIDTILHRPAQFVRRVAHQFRWFWIGDKRNRQLSGTLEHLAYMLPLLLGAIAAMLLQWRTSGCLILIAVPTMIIHSVVVALVNESMYSAPVLPILAVMSACAAGDLVNRWRQSKHRHAPVMAEAAAA